MSEQIEVKNNGVQETQGDHSSRHERRQARRADPSGGWLGGLLFIGLGVLFLLQNAGYLPHFDNWWALFLLLPALASFSTGWRTYRNSGQWTGQTTGPVLAGMLFVGLTAVFLFDLSLSVFGPLLLIGAGLLVIFGPR